MDADIQILEAAVKRLSIELDRLIAGCIDEQGLLKQPTMQDVMRARGVLPKYCKNSFTASTIIN